jgi:hypothetical protein
VLDFSIVIGVVSAGTLISALVLLMFGKGEEE